MIIAHISDTHIAVDLPDADRRLQNLEQTIAHINGLDPLPDAIVHTGDLTQHGRPEEYRLAEAALAKARAPFYLVPGNRDNRANLRAAFASRGFFPAAGSTFLQYVVERHPVRLFVLDTIGDTNKGDYCPDRVRHLIEMADADATRPIAAFTHHPPFDVPEGPERLHYKDHDAMGRLTLALAHSGRVAGVFSGHVHRAVAGHAGTIRASVTPCIATPLRWGTYPEYMKTLPVYHLHQFQADGGFSTQSRVVHAA